MILNVIFRCNTSIKSLVLFFLLSTNLFAFNSTIKNSFSQNEDLITYEKHLQTYNSKKGRNPLENALSADFNQNEKLKTLIFKKKNDIALKNIALYLKIMKNKDILDIYKKYNENHLNKISKKRLRKQKDFLQESLYDFQNFTGSLYKKTKLKKIINNFTLPSSAAKAYTKFRSLDEYKRKAVFMSINTDIKNKLLLNIKKYYLQYEFLNKNLKLKNYELQELNLKKPTKDNSKILEYNKKILLLKINIIDTKYNILYKKCKISYIIGTLLNNINVDIKKAQIIKKSIDKKYKDLSLKRIHFSGNSTTISSYSIPIVDIHAKKLLKIDNYMLELHGYSDSSGDKKTNYKLSLQRAKSIKRELVRLGINKNKIKIFAHGDKKPIASNKTKKGRLFNRRVEFRLYKDN